MWVDFGYGDKLVVHGAASPELLDMAEQVDFNDEAANVSSTLGGTALAKTTELEMPTIDSQAPIGVDTLQF